MPILIFKPEAVCVTEPPFLFTPAIKILFVSDAAFTTSPIFVFVAT
jgi:hypothetical protein